MKDVSTAIGIFYNHTVSGVDQNLAKMPAMLIVQNVMNLLLPYLGNFPVVATQVEIHVQVGDESERDSNGSITHGSTQTLTSNVTGRLVTYIKLNLNTIRNTDNLISTLVHELAHLLTTTHAFKLISKTMDNCGGHTDYFYGANCMLVLFLRAIPGMMSMLNNVARVSLVGKCVDYRYRPRSTPYHRDPLTRCTYRRV
jgi:hypothetical protein